MRASCLKWFCHGNQYIGMSRYEQVTLLKLANKYCKKKEVLNDVDESIKEGHYN